MIFDLKSPSTFFCLSPSLGQLRAIKLPYDDRVGCVGLMISTLVGEGDERQKGIMVRGRKTHLNFITIILNPPLSALFDARAKADEGRQGENVKEGTAARRHRVQDGKKKRQVHPQKT